MTHSFVRPQDITMFDAMVTHLTINGSAFATMPNDEKVFIPGKIADTLRLGVGDYVKVYAVGNHPDHTDSAKYRAIRAIVDRRLEEVAPPVKAQSVSTPTPVPVIPEPEPTAAPVLPASKPSQDDLYRMVAEVIKSPRVWTAKEVFEQLFPNSTDHKEELRLTNVMKTMHKRGEIASARVLASADQTKASYTFYACDTKVFAEIISMAG